MHHDLDIHPVPCDKEPLFVNEPWLADNSCYLEITKELENFKRQPNPAKDNIRIYVPMDLNREAILHRLNVIISQYGAASERNEMAYSFAVSMLLEQVEIYDQIWFVRHMPKQGKHSAEAAELVRDIIERLENIEDDCANFFPFEEIRALKTEYEIQ